MPSSPIVEIDCRAVALTLGLAWKAMPRPARLSIGRSFAPSPTATDCAMLIDSNWHSSRSSSALRRPSTISPT